jgi:hypothetical protein
MKACPSSGCYIGRGSDAPLLCPSDTSLTFLAALTALLNWLTSLDSDWMPGELTPDCYVRPPNNRTCERRFGGTCVAGFGNANPPAYSFCARVSVFISTLQEIEGQIVVAYRMLRWTSIQQRVQVVLDPSRLHRRKQVIEQVAALRPSCHYHPA